MTFALPRSFWWRQLSGLNEQDILSPAGFPEMPPSPGEDTLITVVQIRGPIQLSFPKLLCLLMTYPTALISNRAFHSPL